jgi:hypothetical protein
MAFYSGYIVATFVSFTKSGELAQVQSGGLDIATSGNKHRIHAP